jgi:hypothetical protein
MLPRTSDVASRNDVLFEALSDTMIFLKWRPVENGVFRVFHGRVEEVFRRFHVQNGLFVSDLDIDLPGKEVMGGVENEQEDGVIEAVSAQHLVTTRAELVLERHHVPAGPSSGEVPAIA